MYYLVSTMKTASDAARDLEAAVRKHDFGVLHVHDLDETLTRKGYPLGRECRVFEVCNPQHATRVLARDMRLSMALPCRISVFEDGGVTKIGTILPTDMLRPLSADPELGDVAAAVETTLKAIIDDAAAPRDPREALLLRRAALAREIEAGAASRSATRDGNVPDSAELAADDVTRDVGLAAIDRDTYGQCVDCATAIAPARLARNPEAARCVACQLRRERESPERIASL
jgi:uncharacterized protein (DUF302 family)